MASWRDYISLKFDPFVMEDHIARGGECEVYSVRHTGTGRVFVVRLPAIEDRLWEGEPMCPPINLSLEMAASRNAFLFNSTPKLYQSLSGIKTLKTGMTPHYYGIRDSRYMISLSAPYRIIGAIDIEDLLDRTPAKIVAQSEFFQELVLGTSVALLNVSEISDPTEVERDWLPFVLADPAIRDRVSAMLRNMDGHLATLKIDTAIDQLSQRRRSIIAVGENLLVRLCVLLWSGILPQVAGEATMRCEHFRNNITAEEISQFIACSIIQSEGVPLENGARFRMPILAALKEQPIDPASSPEAFAPCVPPDVLKNPYDKFDNYYRTERFSLFVVEKVGSQPFLSI